MVTKPDKNIPRRLRRNVEEKTRNKKGQKGIWHGFRCKQQVKPFVSFDLQP